MIINGLQKLTLLDYPSKTAATVFLSGCNFKCPFCHNSDLVVKTYNEIHIEEEELFTFLKKRIGLLDGVCISGGEPTLRKNLIPFARKIKDMGFLVKLDTNGTRPDVIKKMIDLKIVDFVAMDIKNSKEKYGKTAGILIKSDDPIIKNISESIELLKNSLIDYEFRTTAVKEFHNVDDFIHIGKWINGANKYYIQNFYDSGRVIKDGLHGFNKEELLEFKNAVLKYVKLVDTRGV